MFSLPGSADKVNATVELSPENASTATLLVPRPELAANHWLVSKSATNIVDEY